MRKCIDGFNVGVEGLDGKAKLAKNVDDMVDLGLLELGDRHTQRCRHQTLAEEACEIGFAVVRVGQ